MHLTIFRSGTGVTEAAVAAGVTLMPRYISFGSTMRSGPRSLKEKAFRLGKEDPQNIVHSLQTIDKDSNSREHYGIVPAWKEDPRTSFFHFKLCTRTVIHESIMELLKSFHI